ncbi:MAG: AtpZ/AtpI family protein [Hyphomicrobiales bacterium]|nr:AtpZ/AtpI family protein [Hyphomicrobiales bacterium]
MAEPHDGSGDGGLQGRLDSLKDELGARRRELVAEDEKKRSEGTRDGFKGAGYGFTAVSELVAGAVVGAGLGWSFDRLFGTKPILLIAFFLLGLAAGVTNLVRATNKMTRDAEARGIGTAAPKAPDDDED